jgi:MazG family protein
MTVKEFETHLDLIRRLRSEEGCPWDRAQTIESLKNDLMSEAEEVEMAINKEDFDNLKEELGDLIWSIVLITQIAEEKGLFTMKDVLNDVNEKIIRRHPHVFGDLKVQSADEALKLFYKMKANEKTGKTKDLVI